MIKWQDHIQKYIWMGDTVVTIFEECNLPHEANRMCVMKVSRESMTVPVV